MWTLWVDSCETLTYSPMKFAMHLSPGVPKVSKHQFLPKNQYIS